MTTTTPTPAGSRTLSPRETPTFWTRAAGPLYVSGIFWCRLIAWACRGPDWFVRPTVAAFALGWSWLLRRHRRVVVENLAPVLGPCGFWQRQARLTRVFHNHAWFLTERFQQFGRADPLDIEMDGAAWHALRASHRGAILVTAHIGSWELGAVPDLATGGRRLHVVREPEESPQTQRYVEQLLARHPNRSVVTHFVRDDQALGITLLEALRRGDFVALAGDRARRGMATTTVSMFGRRTELPIGPLALARAAQVPLVPVFLFRRGLRRYRFVAREPFAVARTADRQRDLGDAAGRVAAAIAWAIEQRPLQWVRWETVWTSS
jgi:lauroyl/myristoyl acyltransferase